MRVKRIFYWRCSLLFGVYCLLLFKIFYGYLQTFLPMGDGIG